MSETTPTRSRAEVEADCVRLQAAIIEELGVLNLCVLRARAEELGLAQELAAATAAEGGPRMVRFPSWRKNDGWDGLRFVLGGAHRPRLGPEHPHRGGPGL